MAALHWLRLPQRETVDRRPVALMEAAATLQRADQAISAWAEELERLAGEVRSLRPAALLAIRTVLDAVAADDTDELKQAQQLRDQIDALDQASVSSHSDSGDSAVPEPFTSRRRADHLRHLSRVRFQNLRSACKS